MKRYDFSNLANESSYENMDTFLVDLTRKLINVIQSGDLRQARQYVESEPFRMFLKKLLEIPEYISTSHIFFCAASYTSALGAVTSYSEAGKLLGQIMHLKISSADDFEIKIPEMILAFTSIVAEDKGRREESDMISRACAYIQDHLYTRFELETLADYCGYSLSYLRHSFRKQKGISLVTYIRNKKTEKAKELLIHTDLSIVQISSQLGFGSESYFISVFRKLTGKTPRQYRRQQTACKE